MTRWISVLSVCGMVLSAGVAESASAQSASAQSEEAHRRWENARDDRQRFEAEEREKDREAALEIERIRGRSQKVGEEPRSQPFAASRAASAYYSNYAIAASGDPLAGTDAATYKLGNGVIMRISGTLWPSEMVSCISYCP